jgi:hypothetical protein
MFLERTVGSWSYGCVQLHVHYVTLSASKVTDSDTLIWRGIGVGDRVVEL